MTRYIRTREACRRLCQRFEVDVIRQRLILCVDLQNCLAPAPVGRSDVNLPVEPTGSEKRRVEDVLAVGCGDDNDAGVAAEAVHFDQQLVERLLAFVVSAAQTCAAATTDGVNFVNEDDRGSDLLCLLKQISDAACADADIQLDKVGAGDGQERYAGFSCNSARQKRFAGTRRTDEQHALRNFRAQAAVAFGIAQKIDNLRQFLFFLVRAGNVLERDGLRRRNAEAGVCLCEVCHTVRSAVGAARQEKEQGNQHNAADDIRRRRAVPRLGNRQIVVAFERAVGILIGNQRVQILAELLGIADFCGDGRGSIPIIAADLHGKIAAFQCERSDLFIAEQVEDI